MTNQKISARPGKNMDIFMTQSRTFIFRPSANIEHLHQIFPQIPMTRLRSTLESSGNDLQTAVEQLAPATCTNNVQGN